MGLDVAKVMASSCAHKAAMAQIWNKMGHAVAVWRVCDRPTALEKNRGFAEFPCKCPPTPIQILGTSDRLLIRRCNHNAALCRVSSFSIAGQLTHLVERHASVSRIEQPFGPLIRECFRYGVVTSLSVYRIDPK